MEQTTETHNPAHSLDAETMQRIGAAVERLNHILPLKARQEKLSEPLRRLHREILNAYVEIGRTLSKDEISRGMANADQAIKTLAENDMIVVDADGELTGAYPFTMEKREHQLKVNAHQVHCMCALDALAVNPMFGADVEINSRCRVSGEPIRLHQLRYGFDDTGSTREVFFGIDWKTPKIVWQFIAERRQMPFRSSAAATEDVVIVGSLDKSLHALDPASGESRWSFTTRGKIEGSPVIVGDHVYRLHSPGILKCWDRKSGRRVYVERLDGITTTWASPIVDPNGRIFFANAGKSFVIQAGPTYKVLAVNELGDPNHTSPAVSGRSMFLVGTKYVYCIREANK